MRSSTGLLFCVTVRNLPFFVRKAKFFVVLYEFVTHNIFKIANTERIFPIAFNVFEGNRDAVVFRALPLTTPMWTGFDFGPVP